MEEGEGAEEAESLALWARAAASLQPDGTRLPARRCQVRLHGMTSGLPLSNHKQSQTRVRTRQYCASHRCWLLAWRCSTHGSACLPICSQMAPTCWCARRQCCSTPVSFWSAR